MDLNFTIPKNSEKSELYKLTNLQLKALMEGETDFTAILSNASALLKDVFHFWWVGFYLVKNDQLVLGPFQGPLACTRIDYGKGVCGTAWKEKKTILVPDVEQFPGHIACSAASKSEIVVPISIDNQVKAVLDVDSEYLDYFDQTDADFLEEFCAILAPIFS